MYATSGYVAICSPVTNVTNLQGYPKAAVRCRTCIEIPNLGQMVVRSVAPVLTTSVAQFDQRGFQQNLYKKMVAVFFFEMGGELTKIWECEIRNTWTFTLRKFMSIYF